MFAIAQTPVVSCPAKSPQGSTKTDSARVGLQLFSEIKAMVISDGKQDTERYWFPYSDATLKAVKDSLQGSKP